MIVLDTHIWIWWVNDSPRLTPTNKQWIKDEVGSRVNDSRKKLISIFERDDYNLIVCEHKNRLTRVGFNYIKVLLNSQGKDVEVINEAREEKEDLMQYFISIITSFCAIIYGLRRQKRKTECIIKCLESKENDAS